MVYAYSSGAPSNRKVCTSLIPGHGSKQNTPVPYKLTLNEINENVIQIDLVSTIQVTFAGFIVQARDFNEQNQIIDGYFTNINNNTRLTSCLSSMQNTWTHSSSEPKTKVSAKWFPNDGFTGSVYFIATVVQVKQAYWDQIRSSEVYFLNGKLTDEINYAKHSKLLNDNEIVPETASKLFDLNYEDCNKRMCIGLGEEADCFTSKSCRALLSVFKNDNGQNEFILLAKPSGNSINKYYSMAFSEDNKMGDDFVVDCLVDSNGMSRVDLSYNEGKTNTPLRKETHKTILQQSSAQYIDGILKCIWKLRRKFSVNKKEYDLHEKKYHIFLASGDLESDHNHKDYHDMKIRTQTPVDLGSTGNLQIKDLSVLIRIHGSLMLIVWFGLVPTAIILARYFKNAWQGRLLCGVQLWFAFHRGLMILSICLMLIAQACIFYYVGEYRVDKHQILGSIAFILALFQPIGAIFRPHPGTPKRWIFNWMHWLGGTVASITAVAAILVASKLKLANLPDTFLYVAIVWILCHVVLHLLFQFYSFCSTGSKTPDIALQDMRQRQMYGSVGNGNGTKSSKHGFHYFLLTFYIVLVAFLVSVLVIFVAFPNVMKDLL